jgi:ribosomal protein L12E/L44/L45/RPP1/RPP2
MKYIAAYLLCVVGGNATPDAGAVTKVIEAAGGEVDSDKLSALISDMEGKDLAELLSTGETKLASVSGGGGGGGGGAAAGGDAPAAVEEKKEEEEVDFSGGMDMFGGGGGGGDY